MQINKSQLLKALEIVKPGLANKDIIEQCTSFAFIKGRVVTYNDEISISHPVEGLEIEGAIKADKLYALLSKIKREEIEISLNKNEILVKSGKMEASLTLESEIKLPLQEDIAHVGKWKDLPETFIKSMSFVMTTCSRDMSTPILTCVHVNKEGLVEASDNHRIAQYKLNAKMPVETFLLPASSTVEMVKLNPIKIAEGKGWIHFKTENDTVISCRIFEDEYVDTRPFMKVKGIKLSLPKSIEGIIDRASVFAKRDHIFDETLIITVNDNRIKVVAKSDSGSFKEESNIAYKGESIEFAITPYLLRGILCETLNCELDNDKLKFEGEEWVYITCLKHLVK